MPGARSVGGRQFQGLQARAVAENEARLVVGHRRRAHRVGRADRDQHGVVRRIGESRADAGVAGRRDHDDSGLPRLLDRVGERVDLIGLRRVRAVREVDDPDVHPVVVAVLHDPVDRRDHLAHVDAAVRVTDLDREDPRVRGDAAIATRLPVVAADDSRHERAVAVRVEVPQRRVLRLERQVGAVDDLVRGAEPGHGGDARVDEGDVDSRAGVAAVPPGLRAVAGHDVLHGVRVGRRVVGRSAPRGARPDQAEGQSNDECE